MKKYKQLRMICSTSLLTACTVFGIRNSEEAAYSVLENENNIQVRQYQEALVAQTQTSGNYDESSTSGFKLLAGYIFGENQSKENIEMTTPVLQKSQSEKIAMTTPVYQQENNDTWTMTFVLPSKYTLETVPAPLNKNIEIKKVPAKKVASIRYTGFITSRKIEDNAAQLQSWLDSNGYTSISEPYSAGYDPPWTIPFFRRNEVHIEIE
jgi:hypothetical protein